MLQSFIQILNFGAPEVRMPFFRHERAPASKSLFIARFASESFPACRLSGLHEP